MKITMQRKPAALAAPMRPAPFAISPGTLAVRQEAAELLAAIEAARTGEVDILGEDQADEARAIETIAKLRATRDLNAAKLQRVQTRLYAALIEDGRRAMTAAEERAKAARFKVNGIMGTWRLEKGARFRGELASVEPSELRAAREEKTAADEVVSKTCQALAGLDWQAYESRRLGGIAIPIGGWEDKATFRRRAAEIVPELAGWQG